MNDADIRAAIGLLSQARLAPLSSAPHDCDAAIARHTAIMDFAAALWPVIGYIEIGLRNGVCARLTETFGATDWLMNPPAPFTWKNPEAKTISSSVGKLKREKGQNAISNNELITHINFSFWKRLFSEDYETTLWKRSLKLLFPNKIIQRRDIAANLEKINLARNRIAHHEPILGQRLIHVIHAVDFISDQFAVNEQDHGKILRMLTAEHRRQMHEKAHELLNHNHHPAPEPPTPP